MHLEEGRDERNRKDFPQMDPTGFEDFLFNQGTTADQSGRGGRSL